MLWTCEIIDQLLTAKLIKVVRFIYCRPRVNQIVHNAFFQQIGIVKRSDLLFCVVQVQHYSHACFIWPVSIKISKEFNGVPNSPAMPLASSCFGRCGGERVTKIQSLATISSSVSKISNTSTVSALNEAHSCLLLVHRFLMLLLSSPTPTHQITTAVVDTLIFINCCDTTANLLSLHPSLSHLPTQNLMNLITKNLYITKIHKFKENDNQRQKYILHRAQ